MANYSVIPQSINVDGVTLQNVSGTVSVKTGGIGATQLADATTEVLIKDVSQGSASATFDITSIPSGYQRLRVEAIIDTSAGGNLTFQFNNDTGANYQAQYGQYQGATSTGGASGAGSLLYVTTSIPNVANQRTVDFSMSINNEASKHKIYNLRMGSGANVSYAGGAWINTASQISSIKFTISTGTIGTISRVRVFGIKGA